MPRGSFQFETTEPAGLRNSASNVEALRRLWLDRFLVEGEDLGPGARGDFAFGAWHVACHLVAAGGVRRAGDGSLLWLEISHDPKAEEYYASVTVGQNGAIHTERLDSAPGRALVANSRLLGFIEGNSTGRISARGVNDPADRFNLWRRQDFDQPTDSDADGGKVWEHWCTLRDIRASARIGSSVLTAYVSLVEALSDLFVAAVARGRRDYGHPTQLAAMVYAGFVSQRAAVSNLAPTVVPESVEAMLLEAQPASSLEAAERLPWGRGPRYYMFKRKIRSWSRARNVRADLKAFTSSLSETP